MDKGAKWRVIIPSSLAYGLRGNREIPPNAPLDFIIELEQDKAVKGPNIQEVKLELKKKLKAEIQDNIDN